MRIPVRVKNDARVGRDEVDAQPARARRQQEDINRLVRVEIVHRLPALVVADGAVEPAEAHALPREVVLEDVEHARHLREDQDLVVTLGLELAQDAVEQLHLARGHQQDVVDDLAPVGVDRPLEEVRVVAALAELHQHVLQPHLLAGALGELPLEQVLVHLLLPVREPREQNVLVLFGQADLDVRLEPPQQKRPQDLVELGDDRVLELALHDLLLVVVLGEVEVEPRLERVEVVEDVRQQEVEQRPQLGQVVLQRRAGQEQPEGHGDAAERFRKRRRFILEPVPLVDCDRVEEQLRA
mmetsp:Transcript_41676/g.114833  ORF Transcript_41676/g.114833 Transcript_41676/m.114833 type:complete len:297 (+) Transcript_41676:818-1708(+)